MDTFGELLKWFRMHAGLDQQQLADRLTVHRNTISAWENSRYLPEHSDRVEKLAKELYLSEAETNQLLAAAKYPPKYHIPRNGVSSTPSEPDVNLSPSHKGIPTSTHTEQTATRTKYLEGICQRYGTLTLPIGPAEGISLQAIFQPLKLRRDPLAAEDLVYEERRALLGESRDQNDNLQRAGRGRELLDVTAIHGEDALHKSPQGRMVVLGGPGTGKTTLLMSLLGNHAWKALTDASMSIPVFISLPDLARFGQPLQDYLLSLTKNLRVDDRYALALWKAIEDGHAFICLDSLDEVTPRERPEMIRLLNELASCPGNTWIVGSRFTEYKGGQFKRGQFTEWELQSMSDDLRLQLAHRLLPELHCLLPGKGGLAEDEPAAFVRTLALHDRVVAWGQTPLLFSLAAVVFVRTGALPSSAVALYQQVIDAIFETREQDPTRRKMLRRVAADLALELYQTKGRTFTREDMVMLLPTIRQRQFENWSTEEMTNCIITSGILDVVAQETYGFRHQTFQEYLAVVGLAQRLVSQRQEIRDEGWSLAWSKRTYSRWTEILRLTVGVLVQNYRKEGARQARRWLHELAGQRGRPEGDPGDLGLVLALESLIEVPGEKMGTWKEVGGEEETVEIVKFWIAALLGDVGRTHLMLPSPAWKVNRHYLSEQVVRVAVEQLAIPLNDTEEQVRHAATRALGMLGEHCPKVAVEQLMIPLRDTDGRVRLEAVYALGMLGEHHPKIAAEQLIILLSNMDGRVRQEAVRALGTLGEHVPVEIILAALEDKNVEVRRTAMSVFGKRVPIEYLLTALARLSPYFGSAKRGKPQKGCDAREAASMASKRRELEGSTLSRPILNLLALSSQ